MAMFRDRLVLSDFIYRLLGEPRRLPGQGDAAAHVGGADDGRELADAGRCSGRRLAEPAGTSAGGRLETSTVKYNSLVSSVPRPLRRFNLGGHQLLALRHE